MRLSGLDSRARAFRLGHAAIALIELGCVGYVWTCALTRRRDRLLAASLIVLSAQNRLYRHLGYDNLVYLEDAPEYSAAGRTAVTAR